MAKPGELAELIAVMFTAELPTVRHQARHLRDHGFMVKEKGGRGAGTLTASDAAHLLIAAAGTRSVKESVKVVTAPGQFRSRGSWGLKFLPLPELVALPPDHTLVDAVTALIEAAVSGSLEVAAEIASGGAVDLANDLDPGVEIRVALKGPLPSARISIALVREGELVANNEENKSYTLPKTENAKKFVELYWPSIQELDSDLRSEFTFSHKSIMRVANLLRGT